jgi:hypothetical protein
MNDQQTSETQAMIQEHCYLVNLIGMLWRKKIQIRDGSSARNSAGKSKVSAELDFPDLKQRIDRLNTWQTA